MTDLEPLREALAACDTVLPDELADTLFWAIDATRENPTENPLCVMATENALLGYRSRQGEVDRLREALAGMLESFDILTGESPIKGNELAMGCIRGAFLDEPWRARELLAKGTA